MNFTSFFRISSLRSLSFALFSLLVGLLPFFFIPFLPIEIVEAKSYLLVGLSFLSGICFLIHSLSQGTTRLFRSWAELCFLGLPLVAFLSACFSSSFSGSVFGNSFELGTVASLASLSIIGFLSSVFLVDQSKREHSIKALLIGILASSLIQIALFIAHGFQTTLLVGTIMDWGIIHGFVVVLSVFLLSVRNTTRFQTIMLSVIGGLSFLFLLSAKLFVVWIAVGSVSLLFFIFLLFVGGTVETEIRQYRFPILFFSLLLFSLFATIGSPLLDRLVPSSFTIHTTEIRPSAEATLVVGRDIFTQSPFLGAGPNRFKEALELFKPSDISASSYSGMAFSFGFGFLPTLVLENGILGLLAIFLLIGAPIFMAVKILRRKFAYENPLIICLGVNFLYFLFFVIWFVPTVLSLTLFFVVWGIIIGLGRTTSLLESSLPKTPAVRFFAIMGSAILLVFLVGGFFFVVKKTVARGFISYGILQVGKGNEAGEQFMDRGFRLDHQDSYARSLALYFSSKTSSLLDTAGKDTESNQQIQTALSSAISYAQAALRLDQADIRNYIVAGDVYTTVVPLKAENAYNNAAQSYKQALVYSPSNPDVMLRQARLEATAGHYEEALIFVSDVLAIKPLSADAYILRSQILSKQGNGEEAMNALTDGEEVLPNDPSLLLEIGRLGYVQNNLSVGVPALLTLISETTSVDAHYLLGLSYDRLGRKEEAIRQFEALVTAFPSNQIFQTALTRLQQGLPAQ